MPLFNPFRWPPTRLIGVIHLIDAVGGAGRTEHHGDDVCGGSCVDVLWISHTIPTVRYLRGGSFLFPPEPIGVKLLGPPEGMAAKAHIGCCVF